MKMYNWDDQYLTGIETVDKQHQYMFDLINRFQCSVTDAAQFDKNIDPLINELWDYTQYHFKEEETLMAKKMIDKRFLHQHKMEHHQFLKQVELLQSLLVLDNLQSIRYLFDFLAQWLTHHIVGIDQSMVRQVNAIDNGLTPEQAYTEHVKQPVCETAPLLQALADLFRNLSNRNQSLTELNDKLDEKLKLQSLELVASSTHLRSLEHTDYLTGVWNRRFAIQELDNFWERATTDGSALACIVISVDHLKTVNDLYGHEAGDRVLLGISESVKNCLDKQFVLCRLCGDEFIVLCPNTNMEQAMVLADRIESAVSCLRIRFNSGKWEGSVSVGVAAKSRHTLDTLDLLKEVDSAIIFAKKSGKNCVKRIF